MKSSFLRFIRLLYVIFNYLWTATCRTSAFAKLRLTSTRPIFETRGRLMSIENRKREGLIIFDRYQHLEMCKINQCTCRALHHCGYIHEDAQYYVHCHCRLNGYWFISSVCTCCWKQTKAKITSYILALILAPALHFFREKKSTDKLFHVGPDWFLWWQFVSQGATGWHSPRCLAKTIARI